MGTLKHKPHCPPDPGNVKIYLGSSCEIWGTRLGYKFLSGRYWQAGTSQRESKKYTSTSSIPWEHLHRHPEVCQTRNLPSKPKLLEQQIGLLLRNTVSVCYMFSVLGVAVCWELSDFYSPMGIRNTSPPDFQSQGTKGHPLGGSCRNWETRHMLKLSSGDTSALRSVIEEKHKDGTHHEKKVF